MYGDGGGVEWEVSEVNYYGYSTDDSNIILCTNVENNIYECVFGPGYCIIVVGDTGFYCCSVSSLQVIVLLYEIIL